MSDKQDSETQAVGGFDIEVPFEHQYANKKAAEVSTYMYKRIPSIATPTIILNGVSVSEWEIPPQSVFNLSKSYLEADILLPATAANSVNLHNGFNALIDTIELLDASSQRLAQIQNVPYFTKLVQRPSVKMTDFLTNPIHPASVRTVVAVDGQRAGLFHRSDTTYPIAVNATGGFPASFLATTTTGAPTQFATGVENYTSVASVISGGLTPPGANAVAAAFNLPLAVRLSIPLYMFPNSIFSLNKDLYFGQTMRLRVTWNNGAKWGFIATAVAAAVGTLTAAPAIATGSDILRMANQSNPLSVEAIKRDVLTKGITLYVPFVTSWRYTPSIGVGLSGVLQTFQKKITSGLGQRLLRVWSGVFNQEADNGGVYYCQNQNMPTNDAGALVIPAMYTQIYTKLDDQNLQDFSLSASNGDIYRHLQARLEGSVCGSNAQFLSSPFMLDDWTPWKTVDAQDGDTMVAGLSLKTERTYEFDVLCNQVGTNANLVNLLIMFAVTQKVLVITKEGVAFQ
jgi:hypothetical protein